MPRDPPKPKPKRVRREKLELAYLRDLVRTLEDKLTLLHSKGVHQSKHGRQVTAPCLATNSSASNAAEGLEYAAQQFKKRVAAVEENQKLRGTIAGQIALVLRLKTILHKLIVDAGVSLEGAEPLLCLQPKPCVKFWDFSSAADDEDFADQMANVARLRLELQQQEAQLPQRTMDVSWELSRGSMEVKRHPIIDGRVVLNMRCSTTVPFKLEVAARAYWRFFCLEHGELAQKDSVAEVSTGTVARSFSLQLDYEGLTSQVIGKYTCQKYVKYDEVIFIWVEYADVLEFAGIKFNGLQFHKRACLKLRSVPGDCDDKSTSTVVETFFETVPVFEDNVVDKFQQTKAFINSAHRSHAKLNNLVSQHMAHLLLDEDWKATFG